MHQRAFPRACACIIVWVVACGESPASYVPEPFAPTEATRAYCKQDSAAVEQRITELLGQLTLQEKVGMMHGASAFPIDRTWQVEGVPRLGIPGLHMLDGPRGVGTVAEVTATAFPVAALRGATWDPELERRIGAAIAREARASGVDVLLAPTLNILRHPRWGRAQETYGEDVHHLGAMGVAFIEGVQSRDVIASVKHFAANSIEDTRFEVDVTLDERALREIYLPHFRRAVTEAQVGSVMTAYNSVNGRHCDVNAHLLSDILKGQWQFAGFVESDWLAGTHGDVEAVRAGLDIEMPNGAHMTNLIARVRDGAIEEAEIDRSVRRSLRAQLCFGLDQNPAGNRPDERETDEHRALALEAAQRGIVLLDNRGALPLDRAAITGIVVTGPLADVDNIGDRGSSDVVTSDIVTALEGITARAGTVSVTHVPGPALSPEDEAAIAAADAVIVVTGLTADDEGEGQFAAGDRERLALDPEDEAFIHTVAGLGTPTIVILEGGSAIAISSWAGDVDAIAMAWYPGSQGGRAIADVLFGDVNPSGRLPVSFPVQESDLPGFDNASLSVVYDYWHGYRYLDDRGVAPLYGFGHGLSYTTFEYASLTIDDSTVARDGAITATVEVTNTGARAGIETVQLYVSAMGSRVERAVKDLRAFAQVALEPGETRPVTLRVDARDLAFYDVAAGDWEVEALDYAIRAGRSSTDLPLSTVVTITP